MKFVIFVFAVLCLFCMINGAKLPSGFHRCRVSGVTDYKTNKCMEDAVQHAIRYLSDNGDASLNLPDLDPLRAAEIAIRQGIVGSPVSLEVIFKNVDIFGLSNYKIKSIRGKVSSPKDFVLSMDGIIDRLKLIGKYEMDGRILIIPVKGSGACNITLDGVRAGSTIIGESVMKNGKEYLKIKSFKMSLLINRAYSFYENLFGDKSIADNMNRFMNENWSDIYSEMRPAVEDTMSKLFEIYTKRIFERIPFKNIFIVD